METCKIVQYVIGNDDATKFFAFGGHNAVFSKVVPSKREIVADAS